MKTRLFLLLLVACITQFGCSSGSASRAPLFKVTGKVTYKGAPVADADVTFICIEAKRSAFGRTNAEGIYKLTTFSSNDGAVEGKHSVTIVYSPPAIAAKPVASIDSGDYAPPGMDQSTDPVAPKSTVPLTYADPTTSGLIAVVSKDGENVHNFDLE